MPWVESASSSFRARYESADVEGAGRVLHSLELTREHLAGHFPLASIEVTVVLHRTPASLSMAAPLLPLMRIATAPAARRYVAGWASGRELHVLAPEALAARASNVEGSRQMLARTPAALYARRVIAESNRHLSDRLTPSRILLELRWAWLLEGAARWFSGQTGFAQTVIARRLREGPPPSFPPALPDALLLGGTVIDLLAREEGEQAAASFACQLHPHGARAALSKAFGGRPLGQTEAAWRSHLKRMAGSW